MAKFFGNLNLVMIVGLIAAIAIIAGFGASAPVDVNSVTRWLHLFFGVLWIGLLYYFNFVQVPLMPAIPAEQKGAVTGHIAPLALFYFRWAAAGTVVTGVNLIGAGMWMALVMAFNVWFIIWPAQKKILGMVEASAEAKAAAGPRALIASRLNTLLSLPMMYCMVSANLG
jgi:uncharacterized membrane protein